MEPSLYPNFSVKFALSSSRSDGGEFSRALIEEMKARFAAG